MFYTINSYKFNNMLTIPFKGMSFMWDRLGLKFGLVKILIKLLMPNEILAFLSE